MHTQPVTQKNSSATLVPPIYPKAPWRVASVRALDGYRLHVCFVDGTEGEVWMDALIHSPGAGVFGCLSEPKVFSAVGLEHGVVTWPEEIDLAPDAMYGAIKAHGKWVLGG